MGNFNSGTINIGGVPQIMSGVSLEGTEKMKLTGKDNNLFLSQMSRESIMPIVVDMYPEYGSLSMDDFMKSMGVSSHIIGTTHYKRLVKDPWRDVVTVESDGNGGILAVVSTDGMSISVTVKETYQYALVDDVWKSVRDEHYIVTNIEFENGVQTITFQKVSGQPADITDFMQTGDDAAGGILSLNYVLKPECFTVKGSRHYKFREVDNQFATLANAYEVCDRAALERTGAHAQKMTKTLDFKDKKTGQKFSKEFWYYTEQMEAYKLHMEQLEMYCNFGQKGIESDDGIITQIMREGLHIYYGSTVTEDNLIDITGSMQELPGTNAKEWTVLCGRKFNDNVIRNITAQMYDGGYIHGYQNKNDHSFVRNLKSYVFGDRRLNFHQQTMFNNPNKFPVNNGGINYKYFAAFIDYNDVHIVRKLDQQGNSKKVYTYYAAGYIPGGIADRMNGGVVSIDQACEKTIWMSYAGQFVQHPHRHAIMMRNLL